MRGCGQSCANCADYDMPGCPKYEEKERDETDIEREEERERAEEAERVMCEIRGRESKRVAALRNEYNTTTNPEVYFRIGMVLKKTPKQIRAEKMNGMCLEDISREHAIAVITAKKDLIPIYEGFLREEYPAVKQKDLKILVGRAIGEEDIEILGELLEDKCTQVTPDEASRVYLVSSNPDHVVAAGRALGATFIQSYLQANPKLVQSDSERAAVISRFKGCENMKQVESQVYGDSAVESIPIERKLLFARIIGMDEDEMKARHVHCGGDLDRKEISRLYYQSSHSIMDPEMRGKLAESLGYSGLRHWLTEKVWRFE